MPMPRRPGNMDKRAALFTAVAIAVILRQFATLPAFAAASVTTLASNSNVAQSPSFTTLTGPGLTESAAGDIGTGAIVLQLPTNFRFNTGASVTATVTNAA